MVTDKEQISEPVINPSVSGRIVEFTSTLRWEMVPVAVRDTLRCHFVDTCGAIIAGMQKDVAQSVMGVQAPVTEKSGLRISGSSMYLAPEAFSFLCGSAAHGIELDDGYREGSVHPGVAVVPALLAASKIRNVGGEDFLLSMVIGYEIITAIAGAAHPAIRNVGFHPTSAVGPFGAAMGVARMIGLEGEQLANALGIAGSFSGGLFAFLNGGGDIKRLHGGQAARGGLMAAIYAGQGIGAPKNIIEAECGFAQAFAYGDHSHRLDFILPPQSEFRTLDCYIKPHACCRHLQPALEALIDLKLQNNLSFDEIKRVEVETYSIAEKHASTDWNDFANAQLSFPYVLAVGMKFGAVRLEHFEPEIRSDSLIAEFCSKIDIHASREMDMLYPEQRPSRVTIRTERGSFTSLVMEASGSRNLPLGDDTIRDKFSGLCSPLLGEKRAASLLERLWNINAEPDVYALVEEMGG